jgi:hypothetical protein
VPLFKGINLSLNFYDFIILGDGVYSFFGKYFFEVVKKLLALLLNFDLFESFIMLLIVLFT